MECDGLDWNTCECEVDGNGMRKWDVMVSCEGNILCCLISNLKRVFLGYRIINFAAGQGG